MGVLKFFEVLGNCLNVLAVERQNRMLEDLLKKEYEEYNQFELLSSAKQKAAIRCLVNPKGYVKLLMKPNAKGGFLLEDLTSDVQACALQKAEELGILRDVVGTYRNSGKSDIIFSKLSLENQEAVINHMRSSDLIQLMNMRVNDGTLLMQKLYQISCYNDQQQKRVLCRMNTSSELIALLCVDKNKEGKTNFLCLSNALKQGVCCRMSSMKEVYRLFEENNNRKGREAFEAMPESFVSEVKKRVDGQHMAFMKAFRQYSLGR